MKKILIVLGIIAGVVMIAVTGITISYNSMSYDDSDVKVHKDNLKYYCNSYETCRKIFRKRAQSYKNKFKNVKIDTLSVPSTRDSDLTVDVLYIPAQKRKKYLLVMASGVHGVEGFTGSALQRLFMEEFLTEKLVDDLGIVFLHGVNPFGFKYIRRVTENNVDLNRNSDVDPALFKNKNDGYRALEHFLNPEGAADPGSLDYTFYYMKAVNKLLSNSIQALRQAVLQGQYEFSRGVYFGGNEFEPQIVKIGKYCGKIMKQYKKVLGLDLHTGYGQRHVLYLFPNPIKDKKIRGALEEVFKGYKIDWGDGDDFYTVTGDFSAFLGKNAPGVFYMPMLFEFGTTNSNETFESLKVLKYMVLENQGFNHGYVDKDAEKEVKDAFLEMYFPDSKAWRSQVIRLGREIFPNMLKNLKSL